MKRSLLVFLSLLGAGLAFMGMLAFTSTVTAAAVAPDVRGLMNAEHTDVISDAVAYLRTQQLADGSLPGFSGGPDAFATVKGVLALAAVGYPQTSVVASATQLSMVDFLVQQAFTYTHDVSGTLLPSRAGLLMVGAVAADQDSTHFGGVNLVEALQNTYHPATGAYSTTAHTSVANGAANVTAQAWSLLALAAAQETSPVTASDFLLSLQELDGGWGFGFGGDVDTTALAIQALLAAGHTAAADASLQAAQAFLLDQQDAQGSWGFSWGGTYYPSADSTAAAMQALVALGYTPLETTWAQPGGAPSATLAAMQGADGSFSFNALGTAHALAGLAEMPLPVFGRVQRARLALTYLADLQKADGSWPTPFGSPTGPTIDVALAFAAAGYDPHTVNVSGPSAMDYISDTAAAFATTPDSTGKLLLLVAASGDDPHDFGGLDLVTSLSSYYSPTLGAFGVPTNTWHQAFAVLALAAAGETVPLSATETLRALQQADGGWKYDLTVAPWNTTTADNTALALQALVAGGVGSTPESAAAVAYLQDAQLAAGGWGNANATAFAIQGLLAAGEELTDSVWLRGGRDLFAALGDMQKSDGPFVSGLLDDAFATRQSVPGLSSQPYPLSVTSLSAWKPVWRAADPDRLVVGVAHYDVLQGALVFPFGSDLNANAVLTGVWSIHESGAWSAPFTMTQHSGYFDYPMALTDTAGYDFEIYAADVDGLQGAAVQQFSALADLSASQKTVSAAQAFPGDTLTYTLSLYNKGALTVTQAVLTDTLGWETGFGAWVEQNEAHLSTLSTTEVLTWAGSIAPATAVDIVFTVQVVDQVSATEVLSDHAVTNTLIYASDNGGSGVAAATFDFKLPVYVFLPMVMRTF